MVSSIKDAVYAAMPQAYADASDNGRLPTPARNILYPLRRITGLGDELRSDYCLKGNRLGLINAYMEDHPEETADWDVLRDARGTLVEPHTGTQVPLGTKKVREYLDENRLAGRDRFDTQGTWVPRLSLGWWTSGPQDRFGSVFYIEKEGFDELLDADRIADRFDIALMSCKGYSVRAARELLVAWAREHPEVKVLIAHDFDKQGIGIYDLIAKQVPGAIDLGLRLDDVEDWDLASEAVKYRSDPARNLAERGASPEEVAFLRKTPHSGRRVELNALTGRRIIDWLEAKFEQHGVAKVIPDAETLEAVYRWVYRRAYLNEAMEEADAEARKAAEAAEVPDDLVDRIRDRFENGRRSLDWDSVIAALAKQAVSEERS